jgi:hypothetical protein
LVLDASSSMSPRRGSMAGGMGRYETTMIVPTASSSRVTPTAMK